MSDVPIIKMRARAQAVFAESASMKRDIAASDAPDVLPRQRRLQ